VKRTVVFFIIVNQDHLITFVSVILFTKATVVVPFAKFTLGLRPNVMDFKEIIIQVQGFKFLSSKGFIFGRSTGDKDEFTPLGQDFHEEMDEPSGVRVNGWVTGTMDMIEVECGRLIIFQLVRRDQGPGLV
jgi:hypothetical protein